MSCCSSKEDAARPAPHCSFFLSSYIESGKGKWFLSPLQGAAPPASCRSHPWICPPPRHAKGQQLAWCRAASEGQEWGACVNKNECSQAGIRGKGIKWSLALRKRKERKSNSSSYKLATLYRHNPEMSIDSEEVASSNFNATIKYSIVMAQLNGMAWENWGL